MIEQNHIEQLIRVMCPNGVEYTTLGALGSFENTGVDKKIVPGEKEITLLNFVDVFKNNYIDASIPTMRVTASDRKIIQCNVLKDDIFVTPSSETRDEIGRAAVVTEDLRDTVYSYHIMRYRLHSPNTITAKYIRYLFDTSIIQQQVSQCAQGLTRFGVSKFQFAAMSIPYPPIEIQKEVVHLLDTFVGLISNINVEVIERQKLYDFCSYQLLNFKESDEIKNVALGDICIVKTGNKPAAILDGGKYKYINAGVSESGFTDTYNCDADVTTTPSRGQGGIGFVAYQPKPFWLGPLCYQLRSMDTKFVSNKYLFYYLSEHNDEILKYKSEGGTPAVNAIDLKKISIPVPPLAEQRAIAEKLDTIEAFINNLKTERDLRQQQYEYYREHLINLLK